MVSLLCQKWQQLEVIVKNAAVHIDGSYFRPEVTQDKFSFNFYSVQAT